MNEEDHVKNKGVHKAVNENESATVNIEGNVDINEVLAEQHNKDPHKEQNKGDAHKDLNVEP